MCYHVKKKSLLFISQNLQSRGMTTLLSNMMKVLDKVTS